MGIASLKNLNLVLISVLAFFVYGPGVILPLIPVVSLCFLFLPNTLAAPFLAAVSFLTLVIHPRYLISMRVLPTDNVLHTLLPSKPFLFFSLEGSAVILQLLVALLLLSAVKILWNFWRAPLLVIVSSVFLIIVGLTGFHLLGDAAPWLRFFLALCMGAWCRFFLAFSYFRIINSQSSIRWVDTVWAIPFWQPDIQTWSGRILSQERDLECDQRQIFQNILSMWAAYLLYLAIRWALFSFLQVEKIELSNLYLVANHVRSRGAGWISLVYGCLQFCILRLWISVNLIVCFLNALGFPMPLGFDRPWKAVSFTDFLSRIFAYYSRVLMSLLYYPIYRKLRAFRKYRPFDQLMAGFLSVMIFSFVFHVAREYHVFLLPNFFVVALHLFARFAIYSFFFSVAICVSLVAERNQRWRDGYSLIKFPLYLFLYSLLFLLIGSESETGLSRFRVLATLLGFA